MKIHHYISIITLAIIVLISSTGLVVNKHYCGGELKSISLQNSHATCGMCESMEVLPKCHKETKGDDCCENEQIFISTQEYEITIQKTNVSSPILLYVLTLVESPDKLSLTNTFDKEYKSIVPPPILIKDIPIITQSFLI
ncbi:MAG: hypothetical protein OEX22_06745 [Cyclobacteriaceae bacterium]|nr:hypothetical protein [Cyclobacteriaceae bacterium]